MTTGPNSNPPIPISISSTLSGYLTIAVVILLFPTQ